ncbi:peptide deformylase [Abyssibius alkaniclasticus]|uniref:peptide deformylase n=1 Tax=Abyssibius alkaniclasticus TaxID=2881234 RepID=UPI002363FC1E|nr:peptide deformylase [Abyssibius alkaniclasticus]UPH71343.1 peptide deformylase [Abyssibius alkaniclasticus]
MTRPFLQWPDARLRSMAEPVAEVTDEIRTIWDEMLAAMYAMPVGGPGVGLAAPQIGVMLRLAVVDAGTKREALRMANPEIIKASTIFNDHDEGSPNLPGLYAKLSRPESVTMRYLDEHGTLVEKALSGLWARSAQHQIDHLNGRMFFDRLGPVKRKMLIARHLKQQKRGR